MPARPPDQKVKILYIEDNRENRMLVRAVLEAAGYAIVEAEDGLAGIEAAIREEPALILLDINLPGVDGYEIVAILKSFPNLASTPVIAVTAYAMQGDRQRTLVAGCDGYIQKPIDVDAFPNQVAEFLGGKRERVESHDEGVYLRELNQRLVYRLLNQVEELKRLNQHFVRRASQLEDLHHSMEDITAELGVAGMLEKLLGGLSRAIGSTSLSVELSEPPGVKVDVRRDIGAQPRSVLAGTGVQPADDWIEVEWRLPLSVRGRPLGVMIARHVLPPGAKADEEQLLKIVADQVAIAVENARLYEGVMRRASEQESLVESGRLLTGTLQVSEVLHRLSELVRSRFGADVVRILIRDEAPGVFHLHAQAGTTRTPKEPAEHGEDDDAGLLGWIVKHRKPLAYSDVQAQPRVKYTAWLEGEGFVSFLGLPLFFESELVGILTILYRQRHVFTPEEQALGEALATSASVAIRNARLYEQTQERLRHTETLLAVSQDASATLELNEILRRTTRAMVRALGADTGGAWLQSEDGSRFVPIVGYHVPKELLGALESASLKTLDPRVSDWRRVEGPIYASRSQEDPRFNHPIARLLPHKSVLIQPMRWKGESIGGFAIAWLKDHHRFTSEELQLAEGIALQAAVASENSRLYEGEKQQVAELKRTQAQLIQSTKLAAIGELAANIAHEINNPLTSVLGFASYLAEQVPPGQPWREELDLIQEEAGRARDIVRDLLHFSRQREFIPQITDLNTVLEQTLSMVRRQGALDSITLREEYAPGLAPVEVDVPRIKQVFLNLINNAVYVMRDRGGSLTIRSSANGAMVQVEVTDTGTGIAPEHLDRIFEPFFTTKPEVSGTGLGLSVSLGIVESHGGAIEVQSELGKGSTFTVKLPAKPGATVEDPDPDD
ncbi:MAG TPA: GAF domain-containing protein [Candidatus Binatia bacterium]|nr:GAF domain-containing protein [Candidatus Binatia bacterium]